MLQRVPLATGSGAESVSTLWDRFRQEGDESAFLQLYDLYLDDLFEYGMNLCKDRDLVKDLIQELFLQLWDRRQQVGEAPNVRAYLLAALRNHLLLHVRRTRRMIRLPGLRQVPGLAEEPALDAWLADETQQSQQRALAAALDQLSARQREAIHLRFYAGLTCDEVAEVMQMEVQSTYNVLHRALQSLRRKMPLHLVVHLVLLVFALRG